MYCHCNSCCSHYDLYGYFSEKNITPKTQKAKSIIKGCSELSDMHYNCLFDRNALGSRSLQKRPILIQSINDIASLDLTHFAGSKIFARPCPKTPKHGFIESRIVSSKKEIMSLFNSIKKTDPDGELVLTSYLTNALYNSILTSSGTLSIGPGHDGATSGKKSFILPVKPEKLSNHVLKLSGAEKYPNTFIEAVVIDNKSLKNDDFYNVNPFYFTQVRGGPEIKAVNDYIPKTILVQNVIKPNDDLVEWEKQTKKIKAGTVVYGKDHTLASHAAIHCVINNIPFITSFEPKVGQKIVKTSQKPAPLNLRDFRAGVTVALSTKDKKDMFAMLHSSACILHNWSYIRNSEHASWLLGLAATQIVRILCAISFGEHRHNYNITRTGEYNGREDIYDSIMKNKKFGMYMRRSPKIAQNFLNKKMFESGYGGRKWSKAVIMSLDIWNTIAHIQNNKLNNNSITKLVSLLNKSVNLMHNSGWLFNKISSKSNLTAIAKNPGMSALLLSKVYYESLMAVKAVKRLKKINKVPYKVAA